MIEEVKQENFERRLRLLELLTNNESLRVDEVCKLMGITDRTFFRTIDLFRRCGFDIEVHKQVYRILPTSSLFHSITDKTFFTEDEALTIRQLLNAVPSPSPQIRHLKEKLQRIYDRKVLAPQAIDERVDHNLAQLYRAMTQHYCVKICDYSSNNSLTISDREVEPFLLLNGNAEVRCYEPASGMNKTFKLSRMGDVKVLQKEWENADKHKDFFIDIFGFSSETPTQVQLLLSRRAHQLLIEEYPLAVNYVTEQSDGRWLFDTSVCSYIGIGRFVFGLFDEIQVVAPLDFISYLHKKARTISF